MSAFLSLVAALVVLAVSSSAPAFDETASIPVLLRSDGNVRGLECDVCRAGASLLQKLFMANATVEEIEKAIVAFCIDEKIEDENVCNLAVQEFKDEVLTVIDQVVLGPEELCGILLGPNCGHEYDPLNQTWIVPLPDTPKPVVKPITPPRPNQPRNRILHLSDFHYDPAYTPGLSSECGEPLCCRPPNKKGNSSTAAGFWGAYNCDVPRWTLEDLLQKLSNKSDDFDWIYWTGDLPPHNVWNQTRSDQLAVFDAMVDMMKKYFPNKMVYSTLGNHESAPVGSFPPPFITGKNSNQWLLDKAASAWGKWLDNSTMATIKKGGFYSAHVRRNLRLISLNTNYCDKNNWWLYINATDPAQQLHWLAQELQAAEIAGEKVHIIAHIPPGWNSCLKAWSDNFHHIVNRYESTIIGQFYGHAHHDELAVYFDEQDTTRPISFAVIGPSVTTYTQMNPGYRIYTIDGDHDNTTNALLDFEVYYMNLTEANLRNSTHWKLEYAASADYGMQHCFPADFADLLKRFESNDTLLQEYYQHHYKMHPPWPSCDATCKTALLCSMKSSRSRDSSTCDQLPDGVTIEQIEEDMRRRQVC